MKPIKPPLPRTSPIVGNRALEDVGQAHTDAPALSELDEAEREIRATPRGRKPGRPHRSDSSYAVGFGRPPKHTQFKPGQSGNPKGRSPQSPNMATIVRQVLGEQTPIRTGGRVRRMSKIEALFRSLLARAFKGDPKAVNALLMVMNKSGYGVEAESSPTLPAGIDHQAIIADFLSRNVAGDPPPTMPADDDPADPTSPDKGST